MILPGSSDYAYPHPSVAPVTPTAGNCHRDRPHWVRDSRGRLAVERASKQIDKEPTDAS